MAEREIDISGHCGGPIGPGNSEDAGQLRQSVVALS
jgi:hypothetical protein